MVENDSLALKVTQASLNQTALDWPQNMANIYAAIDIAVEEGSDMVLMPELCLTGYEVNDDFQRTDNGRIYEALANIAAYAHAKDPNLIVSVGHPWRLQLRATFEQAAADPDFVKNPLYDRLSKPFNVHSILMGGNVVSMTAKANLFNDERGYEGRYFNEWSFRDAEQLATLAGIDSTYGTIPAELPDGKTIPFGRPLVYVTDESGHRYVHAQAICEEKWVAARYDGCPHDDSRYEKLNIIPSITRYLGTKEGVLLEIANASPPNRLKQDKHMHLNGLASEHANIVVDTDGLGTSGATFAQFGHRLISQNGQTISAGQRMAFGQVATTTSIVQISSVDPKLENRTHAKLLRDFQSPSAKPKSELVWKAEGSRGEWDNPDNPNRWKEERIRNQALWLFDYMRKTGSRGIMEALSGGKDSSFNCAMVRVMVELAMHDLGVEGFCEAMAHLPYKDKILSAYEEGGRDAAIETCMEHILAAVYMGTNNSSHETWYAAKTLIDGGDFDNNTSFKGIGGKFIERNVQDLVTFFVLILGVKDTTKITPERMMELFDELSKFAHASPHDYTPKEMDQWGERLLEDYPELDMLVSAALPEMGIAYENLQARPREVLVMAFANILKLMAVANPNLDEAYGAYATFGGDLHSGTVNWNAGLHKEDQEELMQYLEDYGVQGVIGRIIALAPANNNKPSAELQPKKDGEVVQHDEDALQGTFPQKAALARLRHHTKIHTKNGERWMNVSELFEKAREDELFNELDDNQLFNAIVFFYQRWEGPAQHKIHATPIAPTFGENVDKQTSLRTPNLSGGSRDEVVQLGIDLLFQWSEEDSLGWGDAEYKQLRARAWQDKTFINHFYSQIWNRDKKLPNMNYNLRGLYKELKEKGWDGIFEPLQDNHPIQIIHSSPAGMG